MNEVEAIRMDLHAALDGEPWHGPSLLSILAGVDAVAALAHPISGRHSAWEIVLHVTGWAREVARRVRGEVPGIPPEGDWPSAPAIADEDAWLAAQDDLRRSHAELDMVLRTFPDSRLDERMGDERDAPLGTGVTWRMMLLGVLQHDAYHAGQIAFLRKMASASEAVV